MSANIGRITGDDVEILLSDRTREDDALDQLRRRHGGDPRVRFLRGNDNIGWVDHYNALLRCARGRYFMWMAHDDDFPTDYLPRLSAALDTQPDALLAFGALQVVDLDGTPIEVSYLPDLPIILGQLSRADEAIALLEGWNFGVASRGLLRRDESLRRRLTIRHTRGDVDADAYWVFALATSGPIVFVPECTVDKRLVPQSGSSQWPERRGSTIHQLEVIPLMARYLVAARVPPRDLVRVMRAVFVRSAKRALRTAPGGPAALRLAASVRAGRH